MSGAAPPPKPWEAAKTAATSTQGAGPKPWEQPQASIANQESSAIVPRSQPARPWEREGETSYALATTSAYGAGAASSLVPGYASSLSARPGAYSGALGTGYGSGMYGSSMYGSSYRPGYGAGGMTGSMYGGGYGSYGSGAYGGTGGMYGAGGGMYGASGGGMYGAGGGMYGAGGMYGGGGMYGAGGGLYGPSGMPQPGMSGDPNHLPPHPPNAWQSFMQLVNGVMHFFGRLSFLVDENTHAVHFFISALLQLLDRAGSLYAEIARFVLRMLFRKRASILAAKKAASAASAGGVVAAAQHQHRLGPRVHGMPPGAHGAGMAGVDAFGSASAAFGTSSLPANAGTVGTFLGGSQGFGAGLGGGALMGGMSGAGGPQWDSLWSR